MPSVRLNKRAILVARSRNYWIWNEPPEWKGLLLSHFRVRGKKLCFFQATAAMDQEKLFLRSGYPIFMSAGKFCWSLRCQSLVTQGTHLVGSQAEEVRNDGSISFWVARNRNSWGSDKHFYFFTQCQGFSMRARAKSFLSENFGIVPGLGLGEEDVIEIWGGGMNRFS